MPSGFWTNPILGLPACLTYRMLRRRQSLAPWRPSFSRRLPRRNMPSPPPDYVPQALPDDPTVDDLRAAIDAAFWHHSPGYARHDDAEIRPHEYIVRPEEPILFRALQAMIQKSPDRYKGTYGGWTYTYWNLDGWKYWAFRLILNRVRLDEAAVDPLAQPDPNAKTWPEHG